MPKPLQDRLRDPQFDNAPLSVLLQHCETVKDIAAVSKEQANIISTHTKQQHKSSAWYGVRAGRVNASAMHAVVVCNIEKPAVHGAKIVLPNSTVVYTRHKMGD